MEDVFELNITPVETVECSIADVFDIIAEQISAILDTIKDYSQRVLFLFLLSFILLPTQVVDNDATPIEDCTEIVVSPTVKYIRQLDDMLMLEENWDDEGAAAMNKQAVANGKSFVMMLPMKVLSSDLRLFPSELGAVSVKLSTPKGIMRSEIGDEIFSYYIKRAGSQESERHSFEKWKEPNISEFVSSISNLV